MPQRVISTLRKAPGLHLIECNYFLVEDDVETILVHGSQVVTENKGTGEDGPSVVKVTLLVSTVVPGPLQNQM